MEKLGVKSAKHHSHENEAHASIFVYLEPLSVGGSAFCVIETYGRLDEKRQQITRIIASHIAQISQIQEKDTNIVRRFEQSLQAINTELSQLVKKGLQIPFADLRAVLGVQYKNEIYISGCGDISAIFMHQTAKSRYAIYELNEQFGGENQSLANPFITVLDGELHQGDSFYVATKLSSREINMNELQEILITLPPSGALKRIQQFSAPDKEYGGVAFKVVNREISGPPKKVNPISSIEHLGKTKNDTAELLGEQSPDISNIAHRITKPLLKKLSAPGTRGPKRMVSYGARLFIRFLSTILGISIGIGSKLWKAVAKKTKKDQLSATTQTSAFSVQFGLLQVKITQFFSTIKTIPTTVKIIAAASVFSLLLVIGVISIMNSRTDISDSEEAFTALISRITERKDGAEAALIYKDSAQARVLLTEASALIATTTPTNRSQEESLETLRAEINRILYSMRGVTTPELTEIAKVDGDSIAGFTEANGILYGITAQANLYRLNTLTNSVDTISTQSNVISGLKAIIGEGSNLLFIDENNRLARIDSASNTLKLITSGVDQLAHPTDLSLYNGTLYVINKANSQIVRMRPQADGFEAGTNWIISNLTNISGMKSLAIDGDIYALTDSEIKRFGSGRELAYTTTTIDPPLLNASKIWTTVGTNYLYVLDPTEGRIVVYEKSGKFITQYTTEQLKGAVGFTVRENEKKIYFATSERFYSFPTTHLLR